ncbi:unnamed protein product [Lathyrus sativus]|nr:unnamed protein product [Lathyrus sativus]
MHWLKEESNHEPVLSLIHQRVTESDNEKLLVPIRKKELLEALKQMHLDKSTRPDGFNLDFYQRLWEASGQEINLTKSEVLFSCNISRPDQEYLSRLMGVQHVLGIRTHLGLPSMIGRGKKETFSFIRKRIRKRINSWIG